VHPYTETSLRMRAAGLPCCSAMWRHTLAFAVFVARVAASSEGFASGALQRPSWWAPAAHFALSFDDLLQGLEGESHSTQSSGGGPQPISLMTVAETHSVQHLASSAKVNATGANKGIASSSSLAAVVGAGSGLAARVNGSANTTLGKGKQPLTTRSWFSFLRFSISFAFVIKCLCMMSNILFQCSPYPIVKAWREKGGTGETDPAPFITVAYGGCQWCFYGMFAFLVTQKSGFLVLVYSNVVGATLGIYYVVMFILLCACEEWRRRFWMYLQIAGAMVALQAGAMLSFPAERALFFVGLVSSGCSIVGSISMLATVPTVLRTKCSKSMPLPLLAASEISAILWVTCGAMLRDPWITVPNIVCGLLLSYALFLVWKYPADGSAVGAILTPEVSLIEPDPSTRLMVGDGAREDMGVAIDAEAGHYGTIECWGETGGTGGT